MRTTVNIDDELLRAAKGLAQSRQQPLGAVIDDALRRELHGQHAKLPGPPLPTFAGTGAQPGVDLTSNRSLAQLLDEGHELDQIR